MILDLAESKSLDEEGLCNASGRRARDRDKMACLADRQYRDLIHGFLRSAHGRA